MSGTENLFEQAISYAHSNLPCMLGSIEVLMYEGVSRKKLMSIIKENMQNVLLALCITKQGVLAFVEGPQIEYIHYSDILIIYNTLLASESLCLSASFSMIGLPGISDAGYFQMFSNFYECSGDISVGFIFITENQDPKVFKEFPIQVEKIYSECIQAGLISEQDGKNKKIPSKLENSYDYRKKKCSKSDDLYINNSDLLLDDLCSKLSFSYAKINNKDLFDEANYICVRHKILNQSFTKGFNDYDIVSNEEIKVMHSFYDLYEAYLTSHKKSSGNFFYYEASDETNSNNCVLECESFILFASISLFKNLEEINNILNGIANQIKLSMLQYFIDKELITKY